MYFTLSTTIIIILLISVLSGDIILVATAGKSSGKHGSNKKKKSSPSTVAGNSASGGQSLLTVAFFRLPFLRELTGELATAWCFSKPQNMMQRNKQGQSLWSIRLVQIGSELSFAKSSLFHSVDEQSKCWKTLWTTSDIKYQAGHEYRWDLELAGSREGNGRVLSSELFRFGSGPSRQSEAQTLRAPVAAGGRDADDGGVMVDRALVLGDGKTASDDLANNSGGDDDDDGYEDSDQDIVDAEDLQEGELHISTQTLMEGMEDEQIDESVVREISIYRGQHRDDQPNGYGNITFADGTVLVGGFRNGKAHGKGRYILHDGAFTVECRFDKGYIVNKAVLTTEDGRRYQGDYRTINYRDEQSDILMKGVVLGRRFFGYGVKHFQSTSVRYEGLFIDGKPDLRGRFEFPSGDVYEGQISDQLPGPQGIIRFHDGTVYEGAFSENGVVSGPGYFTTPDGETVECTVFRPRTIHLTADGMLDQNGFMVDGVWYGEPPLLQKHQLQSLEHDESSLNNRMAVHLLLTADGKRVDFAQKSRKLAISWCFDTPVDMTRLSKRKLNYWSVRLVRQSMKQRVLIAQSNAFTQVYKSNCWKTTFTIPLPQQQSPTAGSDDEDNSDSSISDGFYDDSGYDSDYNGVSTAEKLNEEPDLIDSSAHYRLELEYNYHMKFTIVSDQFQVVQVDDSCFAHTFPPLSPRSRRRRPIQILNGIGDVDKWHQQFGEGSDTKYFHYQLNEYTTVKGQLSADTRLPYGTIHYELHGGLLVLTANYDGSNGRLNSSAGLTLRYADGQEFRGNHFSLVSMSDIDETDYFDGLLLDGQPHGYKRQLIDPEKGVVYEGLVVESKPAVWGRYWFPDGSYQEGPAVTDRRRQHHKEQEQRELMDGEGFIAVIRDGSRYYGRFDNGKPSGPGIFRYPDGSVHRCNECLPFMYYTKSVGANTSVIRGYIIDQQFHKI